MRLAIVHPYPVHRRAVGGVTRLYGLVRFLAPRHELSVLAFHSDHSDADAQAIADLRELGVDQHLFPRPAPGFGQKASWWIDASVPYYVRRNWSAALADALHRMDRADPFDVVHLELAYLTPFLKSIGPHAVRVLAEQETMSLALQRLASIPWRDRTWYERAAPATLSKARTFETAALPCFDAVFAISAVEAAHMSDTLGREVPVLPHVVDAVRFATGPVPQSGRRLLFVGNFAHHPNLHAIRWFADQVWPALRARMADLELHVAGPSMPEEARAQLARAGAAVRGYVTDLAGCYAASAVVINPIQSGGGMRGKVLEAFAASRAVVSTPMGMEGIDAVAGEHFLPALTATEFAAAVARYLDDSALREHHGSQARRLVLERYDAPVVFGRLEREYERLVEGRRSPLRVHA